MAVTHPLDEVITKAIDNADDGKVSVGELLGLYANRSFGPIFTLLGLLTIIPPIGAIPGLPAAVGLVILLFSVQMLFGMNHIWLPEFVREQSISRDKLQKAHDKSEPILRRIDHMITDRLAWATGPVAQYVAAAIVSLLALALIPLELVPFAVAAPGAAITLFGVALLARDGVLMLTAFALSAAAFAILLFASPLGSALGL